MDHEREWTIREQFDYDSTGMWSILHRNLSINDTRLPKNCLSRIWFKLTVKKELFFFFGGGGGTY